MAYLNCPFCPSQAFPVVVSKEVLKIRPDLLQFRCSSKHTFYVDEKDINERY